MNWYVSCVKNYAGFSGRAHRKEYWMFTLFNAIFAAAFYVIGLLIHTQILYFLYGLAIFIPGLAAALRRLHDTGRSARWLFIGLIPLLGGLILLVCMCYRGEAGENQYGPNPELSDAVA